MAKGMGGKDKPEKKKGDTVTWMMECKTKEGPATFNGKVTYKGETFEGVVKMKQGGMEMT